MYAYICVCVCVCVFVCVCVSVCVRVTVTSHPRLVDNEIMKRDVTAVQVRPSIDHTRIW